MAETTKIEWCDATLNPWIGCTKVSPGCANCYAERDFDLRKHVAKWGAGMPRHRTSEANWKQPLKWDRKAAPNYAGEHPWFTPRPRVFCGSLCDWLDDEVPVEWLADLLDLIRRTPHLDWLLLTKRPQNWGMRLGALRSAYYEHSTTAKASGGTINERLQVACLFAEYWLFGASCLDDSHKTYRHETKCPAAPRNVWIGTTAEDQQRADERIPALLSIPARVRFLSGEPMLGPVNLNKFYGETRLQDTGDFYFPGGIHWVICGGESGPHARPMHPDWARSLRDQCAAAGVAFFMKQMGGVRKPFAEIPADLDVRQFPEVAQ